MRYEIDIKTGKRVEHPDYPPTPEPEIDFDKLDQDTLNNALTAEGSVVRALALVVLDQINALRIKTGDKAYTMPQFMAALRAKMR